MELITEAQLAERFGGGITEKQVATWRRARNWPSTLLGRQHRFTEAQVEEILRLQEHRPGASPSSPVAGVIPGQTARSARKRS
jgi:hypothetical protein